MVITLFGMVTLLRLVQPQKAPVLIMVTLFGMKSIDYLPKNIIMPIYTFFVYIFIFYGVRKNDWYLRKNIGGKREYVY